MVYKILIYSWSINSGGLILKTNIKRKIDIQNWDFINNLNSHWTQDEVR